MHDHLLNSLISLCSSRSVSFLFVLPLLHVAHARLHVGRTPTPKTLLLVPGRPYSFTAFCVEALHSKEWAGAGDSDNGANFVGAERELREAIAGWNHIQINDMLLQKGIRWIFNPPAGSHHGGLWERSIRSVRKVLNSILKTQTLDEDHLHTVFCGAKAIINNRPITKASTDTSDLEALSPNHLLILKCKPLLSTGVFQKEDIYARRRWKQVQ